MNFYTTHHDPTSGYLRLPFNVTASGVAFIASPYGQTPIESSGLEIGTGFRLPSYSLYTPRRAR